MTSRRPFALSVALLLVSVALTPASARAAVFGDVRGVIVDPQDRPMKDVAVTLQARRSALTQAAATDASGAFVFRAVPLGEYVLAAESPGFSRVERPIEVL